MEFLIKGIQLILSLSILITFHELGHFIPAKIFKNRVERFFLFFDPWFAIFKRKIGETVYGIGWLPLGGYVKISGMLDESLDKNYKNHPPQPWEFRSKPSWQRLIIILGGVIVNILLAIIIFSGLLFYRGSSFLPVKNMKYGITVNDIGFKLGFKPGDSILSVDGKYIKNFEDLPQAMILGENIAINRIGKKFNIILDDKKKSLLFNQKQLEVFINPRIPVIIKNIKKNSIAEEYNLQIGDEIITIDNNYILFVKQIENILLKKRNNDISILVSRNNNPIKKIIHIDNDKTLGIEFLEVEGLNNIINIEKKHYNFLDSISAGICKTWDMLIIQLNFFKQIFHIENKAYKQVGSVFSMAKIFSNTWNWEIFWNFTATFSIWLAFLNLLPIPSLDGGYVLFILIEMITGKRINEKFLEKTITIGFLFMMILMIVVIVWDTFKNFFI